MKFDRILSMLGSGWAILPETLAALAQALDVVMAGGTPDVAAFAARGAAESGEELPYDLRGGVAVVPVVGTLVKRNSWLSCFSTYAEVREALAQALDDPRSSAILLQIESPGGTVDGCQELAEFVAAADSRKPVYAFADGQMTSAAYWIGSGAREIAAPPTAVVGSIGVLSVHHDRSGMDEKAGLKRTFISAGAFKALGHDAAPLSEAARGVIQQFLDDTYAIFLRGVCANRGLDVADAAAWADGKVFLSEAARAVGLVDHVMNLDDFIGRIQAQTTKGVQTMDLKQLKAEHPDLVQELRAEFEAQAPQRDASAAVTAETARVVALAGHVFGPEAADKLGRVAASGVTAEQMAAVAGAIAAAPAAGQAGPAASDTKSRMLAAIQAAAPDPVDPARQASADTEKRDKLKAAMADGMKGVS